MKSGGSKAQKASLLSTILIAVSVGSKNGCYESSLLGCIYSFVNAKSMKAISSSSARELLNPVQCALFEKVDVRSVDGYKLDSKVC